MKLCIPCGYQSVCDNCEMSLKDKRNILYSHEEYDWDIKYKEYKGSTIDQLKNKYAENPF